MGPTEEKFLEIARIEGEERAVQFAEMIAKQDIKRLKFPFYGTVAICLFMIVSSIIYSDIVFICASLGCFIGVFLFGWPYFTAKKIIRLIREYEEEAKNRKYLERIKNGL